MKKIIVALCFTVGGIAVVRAQQPQDTTSNQYQTESQSQFPQTLPAEDSRERMQPTDLPDEVKKTLEGEDYRGWLISGAFRSQNDGAQATPGVQDNANAPGAGSEELYVVEMKNGAETRTLTFNSNGEQVEGEGQTDFSQPGNQDTPDNQPNSEDQLDPSTSPSDRSLPTDPTIQNPPAPDPTTPSPTTPDPNATEQPGVPSPTDPTSPAPQTPGTPSPGTPSPGTPSPGTPGQSQPNGPK